MLDFKQISAVEYRGWFDSNQTHLYNRTPFHQPAWLDVIDRTLAARINYVGVYQAGELQGVLPVATRNLGSIRVVGSPLRGTMTSYLGPVVLQDAFSLDEFPALLRASADWLRNQLGGLYLEFILPQIDLEKLENGDPRWRLHHPDSYQLGLTCGKEILWEEMEGRSRTAVRKAIKEGVEIIPLKNADLYYRILESTFNRRGISSYHPQPFFQELFATLPQQDLLWAWGAKYDQEIIAAGLFLHDQREVHYLSGASLLKYRSIPANNLLQWYAIVQAVQEGLQVYDFGGRGIPGIDRFKESFGSDVVRYQGVSWAPAYIRLAKRAFLWAWPTWRRIKHSLSSLA